MPNPAMRHVAVVIRHVHGMIGSKPEKSKTSRTLTLPAEIALFRSRQRQTNRFNENEGASRPYLLTPVRPAAK